MTAILSGYNPSRTVVDPVRDAPARRRARMRELRRLEAQTAALRAHERGAICVGCRRFIVVAGEACRGCGGVGS